MTFWTHDEVPPPPRELYSGDDNRASRAAWRSILAFIPCRSSRCRRLAPVMRVMGLSDEFVRVGSIVGRRPGYPCSLLRLTLFHRDREPQQHRRSCVTLRLDHNLPSADWIGVECASTPPSLLLRVTRTSPPRPQTPSQRDLARGARSPPNPSQVVARLSPISRPSTNRRSSRCRFITGAIGASAERLAPETPFRLLKQILGSMRDRSISRNVPRSTRMDMTQLRTSWPVRRSIAVTKPLKRIFSMWHARPLPAHAECVDLIADRFKRRLSVAFRDV